VGLSQTFSFRAAPEVSADTSVSILLIADMGQGEPDGSMEQSEMVPSLDTTRWMIRDAFAGEQPEDNTPALYQMVAHFGDISYARGHVSQWDRCAITNHCVAASLWQSFTLGSVHDARTIIWPHVAC
jgi:acid phosphatase type 7